MSMPAIDAPRRIHITGVSDVANFGDALFPLVAARRLAPMGYEVVAASPTGAPLPWPDAQRSVPLADLLSGDATTTGLLIGGGHIILADVPTHLFTDHEGYGPSSIPSLWLGASLIAALGNLPIAWNAPGVFAPFIGQDLRAAAAAAIGIAGHVAVRDALSQSLLGATQAARVSIAPDTALDLAALWPRRSLAGTFRRLRDRKGLGTERRLFALHLRWSGMAEPEFAALAAHVDAFAAAHGLLPALVAIGPGGGDDRILRRLSAHMRMPHLLLDDPTSLQEIAALIGHAALYLGNSLHGYVAAAAYGVPGLLIAKPPARRFRGFLEAFGRPQDLARNWEDALAIAGSRAIAGAATGLPSAVSEGLDRHWDAVAATFALGRGAAAPARHAFLDAYLRLGLQRVGTDWALTPVASRSISLGTPSAQPARVIAHAG